MKLSAALCLLGCALSACGAPPTYRTASGIKVWDPSGHFSAPEVDALTDSFLHEFSDRWPAADVRKALSHAEVDILDVHTYESYGRIVAGSTDNQSLRITVAGRDYHLSNCTLAHELVHYMELSQSGATDLDHLTWQKNGTFAALVRIRETLELHEQAAGPGQTE